MPVGTIHSTTWTEPTGKSFGASLATHAGIVALLLFSGSLHLQKDTWGDQHASSGSVGVGIVKTIPIPQRQAPKNPLANDTKSNIPQVQPEKIQPKPQTKAPPIDKAIQIPEKVDKRKVNPKPREETLFRPPSEYKPNQVYAKTPQATSSPMYGMQGSGGIDIGPASVLGNRFGAYVSLMRDRISQHWNTADVRAGSSQKVAISFTINKSGAVNNVQISQPSGNYLLDNSAKRAVVEANPLPALPQQFERNEATVELWFQLKQ